MTKTVSNRDICIRAVLSTLWGDPRHFSLSFASLAQYSPLTPTINRFNRRCKWGLEDIWMCLGRCKWRARVHLAVFRTSQVWG